MSDGPSTDRLNQPVIDPTENVKELVAASILRLDDLRGQSEKYLTEMAAMRAEHTKELRDLEAARIDAIRAVDVAASQQATKDAEVRATALAKQVSDSAEAMRNQVAAAATAAATSLSAALVPIQERLAELTRLQYEQQGQKAQVIESRASDADFAPVLTAIARLETIASENNGHRSRSLESRARGMTIGMWVGVGIAALAVFFTFVSIILYVAFTHRGPTTTPVIITTPAQARP